MFELIKGIQSILEACEVVEAGEHMLVIADNDGKSMWVGQLVMNVVNSMSAEAVLAIKKPEWNYEKDPPAPIAAAMKINSGNINVLVSTLKRS